jgi:hypothetical protein
MSLLQKIGIRRRQVNKSSDISSLIARFLNQPEHRWIAEDERFLDSILKFFCGLPTEHIQKIFFEKRLLLFYSDQKMSCTFYQYKNREIVLVFPELYRRFTSARYLEAHAILAHELGHIYLGHSQKQIGSLQAQCEADRYAWERGFGEELIHVLEAEENASPEIKKRLQYLQALQDSR